MSFLTNNPTIIMMLICCIWPGALFGLGWFLRGVVNERGLPRFSWTKQGGGGGYDEEL